MGSNNISQIVNQQTGLIRSIKICIFPDTRVAGLDIGLHIGLS